MPRPKRVRRSGQLLYWGVFLMFAPIGVLIMMVQGPTGQGPAGWLAALLGGAVAGAISVGWCYAFVRERWWVLIPVIAAQLVVPSFMFTQLAKVGLFEVGMGAADRTRLLISAVMCVVFTAAGFTMFVIHLRRAERIGARALAELDIASQVHASLVPPLEVRSPLAEVYGRSEASSEMGGDLIDVVVSEDRVEVMLGDVSGHGVGAGVVMAMLKGCIRMRLLRSADLGEVVGDANAVLAELTEPHMFATFVAMRVRNGTSGGRQLEFALAGHLPLFHYRAATQDWVQHPNECLPLGVDGAEHFTAGSTRVERGDVLAVFTDGLMEVQNSAGKELGLEGVEAILKRSLRPSLADTYGAVMSAVAAHGPRLDDQSLVLVRIA